MAIVEVKVPQLSESVAEATLLQWKRKVGDAVAIDEILIEVETDKVVMEVPAPAAGVLVEFLVADGATVGAEQLIARIDTEGKAGAAVSAAAAALKSLATCLKPSTSVFFKSQIFSVKLWSLMQMLPLNFILSSYLLLFYFLNKILCS